MTKHLIYLPNYSLICANIHYFGFYYLSELKKKRLKENRLTKESDQWNTISFYYAVTLT